MDGIPPCAPALEITPTEMNLQFEAFSRTFDKQFYANGWKIFTELRKSNPNLALPRIQSWRLYDTAFTWPKIRTYEFVNEQLDKLQHYQDNANVNLSNSIAINNFVNAAKEVRQALRSKYQNDFVDPAFTDSWDRFEKEQEK
jgi:hypothetical protein